MPHNTGTTAGQNKECAQKKRWRQLPSGQTFIMQGKVKSRARLDKEMLVYPNISKKNLIYKTIFFRESQRQQVTRDHFQACFEESFGDMLEEERMDYNLALYENIETHPLYLLNASFKNAQGVDNLDMLKYAVFKTYSKKP